jgi:hypothetical protein
MKMKKGKTTIALRVSLFVFMGLVLNTAVAWACAAWSPLRHSTKLPEHEGPGYPDMWSGGPYGEEGWWQTRRGFGFAQWDLKNAHGAEGDFAYFEGGTIPYRRAGWPMLSFQSIVRPYGDPADPHEPRRWNLPLVVILRRGMQTDDLPGFLNTHTKRRLPVMPIWSGFFVNTAFYGVLIFGVVKLYGILINRYR